MIHSAPLDIKDEELLTIATVLYFQSTPQVARNKLTVQATHRFCCVVIFEHCKGCLVMALPHVGTPQGSTQAGSVYRETLLWRTAQKTEHTTA